MEIYGNICKYMEIYGNIHGLWPDMRLSLLALCENAIVNLNIYNILKR